MIIVDESFVPENQPELTKLREFLSRPVHSQSLLDPGRKLKADEVDLSSGFQLEIKHCDDQRVKTVVDDFIKFMAVCMETAACQDAYKLTVRFTPMDKPREASFNSFSLDIKSDKCVISADAVNGLRKALIYLEEEMALRRYPALQIGKKEISTPVRTRISRSPIAPYRFGGGWELEKGEDFYPEEYLNGLAHCGINAIWVTGTLRDIIPSSILPEINADLNPQSLKRLQNLVRKADNYGIKVYFFCIEPRALPAEHIVFEKHPEIRGASWHEGNGVYETSLCTSTSQVKKFMEEQIVGLFKAVPQLAGLVNIFCGERSTNCRTHEPYGDQVIPCPRCAKQNRWKILTDVLNECQQAIRKVAPEAELIAWSYGLMRSARKEKNAIIRAMDKDIFWLECFEHNGKKKYFSRFIENAEYSLCYLGPSPEFKSVLQETREQNKKIYAKIQLGTTLEDALVPYLPLPESAYKKCRFIAKHKIPGVFMTWIFGGHPDIMLKASDLALRQPAANLPDFLTRLAALYWGENLANEVTKAWNIFFAAFQNYPIEKFTFYYGPISRCPAYQLYLEPQNLRVRKYQYNWGIDRARKRQPFYDVIDELWLGQFSAEEIITLYRKMAGQWEKGVRILEDAARQTQNKEHQIQVAVATTALIQFKSAANVYEFYHLREEWLKNQSAEESKRLYDIVCDEIQLARQMKKLLLVDPRLGFHSELLYYVLSEETLEEKITQATSVRLKLRKLLQTSSKEK
jgi:hypothetical protein